MAKTVWICRCGHPNNFWILKCNDCNAKQPEGKLKIDEDEDY